MKYLLSDGTTTENVIKYIKDLIYVNMLLLPDEIPYFSGGSEELIKDVKEINIEPTISKIVKEIIANISSNFPNLKISLTGVEVLSTSVKVNITINGIIETYEIKRFNKE